MSVSPADQVKNILQNFVQTNDGQLFFPTVYMENDRQCNMYCSVYESLMSAQFENAWRNIDRSTDFDIGNKKITHGDIDGLLRAKNDTLAKFNQHKQVLTNINIAGAVIALSGIYFSLPLVIVAGIVTMVASFILNNYKLRHYCREHFAQDNNNINFLKRITYMDGFCILMGAVTMIVAPYLGLVGMCVGTMDCSVYAKDVIFRPYFDHIMRQRCIDLHRQFQSAASAVQ
jgi:hypothetical protein